MESSSNLHSPEEIKRLLAHVPIISGACELDLMVFLHRHPRTLFDKRTACGFVGYDTKLVAKSIVAFIVDGLLERTQNPMHAARMYLLVLSGPQGRWLTTLLKLASTRQGRRCILRLLAPATPVDMVQRKRRLYAVA